MAQLRPDLAKLEEVAEFTRQRREQTARALYEAAEHLAAIEAQIQEARKAYDTAYAAATTDAWSSNELTEAGFPPPTNNARRQRRRPPPDPRRRVRAQRPAE